jgi:nitrogen fixation NifU-like protein
MSSEDLTQLYQQLLVDHARAPQGHGLLEHPTNSSHQVNPTCGDEITMTLVTSDGHIEQMGWEGHGCVISQSSASFLFTLIDGKSEAEMLALADVFRTAIRSRGEIELDEDTFGDAIALNGVSKYVARVKCAMLPWVALEDALAVA